MHEIRIHGRGGQGVKKSAEIIARAAYLSGFRTQDFAVYGAERRGAPVTSFVRIDKKPIELRGYVFEPDFIIVLDDTIEKEKYLKGAKKETKILINSTKKFEDKRIKAIDATKVALKEICQPIANIALIGAFLKMFKEIPFKNLEKAVMVELGKKKKQVCEKNVCAAKICYEMTAWEK